MGWWKIRDVETGRIDFKDHINSPRKHPNDMLLNGDEPYEEMYLCIKKIIKLYEKEWERKPKKRELKAVFNFCINPLDLEE